jgi:hypothetical protein
MHFSSTRGHVLRRAAAILVALIWIVCGVSKTVLPREAVLLGFHISARFIVILGVAETLFAVLGFMALLRIEARSFRWFALASLTLFACSSLHHLLRPTKGCGCLGGLDVGHRTALFLSSAGILLALGALAPWRHWSTRATG